MIKSIIEIIIRLMFLLKFYARAQNFIQFTNYTLSSLKTVYYEFT